ncbi:Type II secretory pathway, component PulJ [Bhargavaea cecembensis DSE10]|uniref:Type II secretory pathway, component PulJ n=1 Tax=Bhargavaea cecembensis DSE10 TaxID=1235279 RepID=M7P8S2_9BACL|nr:type II secretion system protein [Bhargavaea cecembensis]EMR06904.1 Type II secretory pathway, component PulJ [Bhargavaea cecembensis DSE10]
MKLMDNLRGLTLVEVLAAIVLLGIIFIIAASAFPQMTKMNAATETKQDTMADARMELTTLLGRSTDFSVNPFNPIQLGDQPDSKYDLVPPDAGCDDCTAWERTEPATEKSPARKYRLQIWNEPDYPGNYDSPSLYRIKVTATDLNNKSASSAYGYLEVPADAATKE